MLSIIQCWEGYKEYVRYMDWVEEFDDGNACYSRISNVWYKWRGKV